MTIEDHLTILLKLILERVLHLLLNKNLNKLNILIKIVLYQTVALNYIQKLQI